MLSDAQRRVLADIAQSPMGRVGMMKMTPRTEAFFAEMIDRGFLIEKRLGGFPGYEITPAGRAALEE